MLHTGRVHHPVVRLPLLLGLLAPLLPACSVPQWDPSQPPKAQTVSQLIDAGHYRRALNQLTAASPAARAAPIGTSQHDYLLSRIETGFGHLDAALQLADRSLAIQPGSAPFHVQAANVAGRLASHAPMMKQIALAKRVKKDLDAALAIDPKNEDALYGLVLFSNLAPAFLGGDKARAQQLAGQLVTLNAPRGYLVQAALAHDRKDPVAEEAFIRKAVEADPASFDAHIALANFTASATPPHPFEASDQACQALYLNPTRAESWRVLSQLAGSDGCFPELTGLLATAHQFVPDDPSPAYFAAVALLSRTDQTGVDETGASTTMPGRNLAVATTLLNAYLSQPGEGDTPTPGLARYQLARISEMQGRPAQAADLLRLALNEEPTLDLAKKELKALDKATEKP